MMEIIGRGNAESCLSELEIQQVLEAAAKELPCYGKRVLAIIPDATRSCPLPFVLGNLHAAIAPRAKQFDFLIALGTHPAMSEKQIDSLLGVEPGRREAVFPGTKIFNHSWNDPAALRKIGSLTGAQVQEISGGKFAMDVDVTINKLVFDYDVVLIVGPVFPHEVVGFSGGGKYFFPGICGAELLNFFHWLGAVLTIPKIIGTKNTPVRATIEAASDLLKLDKYALCMVVHGESLAGLYFGGVREAWSAAADLSDKVHITYVDKPYDSILSQAPKMYDDLWTGGKCMYKMENVVADGGELIIYAPHITEISYTHGKLIDEIGYHTLEYFLGQWDRFKHYPWGILAHSSHVRGIGSYSDGVEKPRVKVTVATGIPEERAKKVNLGYRNPKDIRVEEWIDKPGRLYVPKAGEMLYKLKNPPAWQKA
jgi:nickel-dependent lactate racemase